MARATAAAGLFEALVGLVFLIAGFIQYAPEAWVGPLAWMEYAFHPRSLLLGYVFLEGLLRFVVALVSGESLGSFPLYLVVWVQGRRQRRRAEAALGPKVVDTVTRGDGPRFDLRIESCRSKPNWNRLMTVTYEDEFYEIAKQEEGRPPRPFVYLLRRMPEGKIIRGLHHYRPDEALDGE